MGGRYLHLRTLAAQRAPSTDSRRRPCIPCEEQQGVGKGLSRSGPRSVPLTESMLRFPELLGGAISDPLLSLFEPPLPFLLLLHLLYRRRFLVRQCTHRKVPFSAVRSTFSTNPMLVRGQQQKLVGRTVEV